MVCSDQVIRGVTGRCVQPARTCYRKNQVFFLFFHLLLSWFLATAIVDSWVASFGRPPTRATASLWTHHEQHKAHATSSWGKVQTLRVRAPATNVVFVQLSAYRQLVAGDGSSVPVNVLAIYGAGLFAKESPSLLLVT